MPGQRSSVVVLAGPNGAGKSTMAAELLIDVLGVAEFVDADVIARNLPRSRATAITAGRAMLRRLDELGGSRRDFGFETTLASRSLAPRLRRLTRAGYGCHLVFLWLPSADLAVARVADRVRLGCRAGADDSPPLPLRLAQLLRSLSAFDDDVADVRQFDARAAVARFGYWDRDASSQPRWSLGPYPGGG
jgi:predicted kinase